ncbi:MAG: anaerobic ribonucleoside-triphosphate reductase [Candidatus Aenigmatarchaeota archaeon]
MVGKESSISPKLVDDFYSKDKGNILFWAARAERYDKERTYKACLWAGANEKVARDIAEDVDRLVDNRMKMSDVRPLIFALLQKRDPTAARKFGAGEMYVRTSGEVFERFGREKISASIVKETGLAQDIADKIAFETEKFLRGLNLSYLSSQLIREIVCFKLLEHGLEKERMRYTRIGLPVYDITMMIDKGSKENANLQHNPETIHKLMADEVSKDYTLANVLDHRLSEAHFEGQIHIHDLDYFVTRPFCFSHDIRFFLKNGFKPDGTGNHTSIAGPAKKAEVAFLHAAKVLAAAQVNCSGGQGFSYFNTFMAPVVKGLDYVRVKQMAQMFIYEMSQMYIARGGQTVFSSIDLDMHTPKLFKDVPAIQLGGIVEDGVTYADYEDEIKMLFDAFTDVYLKGDYKGKPFNFPKMEVQLYPSDLANGKYDEQMMKVSELAAKFGTPYFIINQPYMPDFSCYQCCSFLMPLDKSTEDSDIYNGTVRGGSLQVVTLNLPQIAYLARGEDSEIYNIIDDRVAKIKEIMLLRKSIIEKNLKSGMLPFLAQIVDDKGSRYLEPSKQSYTIGIVGMNEMVKAHTGKEIHESRDSWMFGLRVMKYLKDKVAKLREETGMNFALARTPAESCSHRLARIDYRRFGERAVVQGDKNTNSIYYTNSFQVRPSADVSLFQRLQLEGAFHPLTDGGAMSHAWLGERNPEPEALMKLTKKIATQTAIQYFAYTRDLSICDSCGFTTGGMHKTCAKCNSDRMQIWSRITGYYQNVEGWNKGKLAELKDRRRYEIPERI